MTQSKFGILDNERFYIRSSIMIIDLDLLMVNYVCRLIASMSSAAPKMVTSFTTISKVDSVKTLSSPLTIHKLLLVNGSQPQKRKIKSSQLTSWEDSKYGNNESYQIIYY